MTHAPQEVAAHLLPLHLALGGLHLLGPAGQSTGQNGNGHHHQKSQREARQGEADVPVGLGKYVVHTQNTQHRADNAEKIAVRQYGREEHIRQKQHSHIAGVPVLIQGAQQQAGHHRDDIQAEGYDEILGRIDEIIPSVDQGSAFLPLLRPGDVKLLAHSRSSLFAPSIAYLAVKNSSRNR